MFASTLDSPLLRIPFLVFAVLATVATNNDDGAPPSWNLQNTAFEEQVTLEPGASLERSLRYEGTHEVSITSTVVGTAKAGARVSVVHDDLEDGKAAEPTRARATHRGCDATFTLEASGDGKWKHVDVTGTADGQPLDGDTAVVTDCPRQRGSVVVRLTNPGIEPLKLEWRGSGRIGAQGNGAPDGALIRVSVIQ
jgi:hypothetical protein